jgi:hypothetical protein
MQALQTQFRLEGVGSQVEHSTSKLEIAGRGIETQNALGRALGIVLKNSRSKGVHGDLQIELKGRFGHTHFGRQLVLNDYRLALVRNPSYVPKVQPKETPFQFSLDRFLQMKTLHPIARTFEGVTPQKVLL